MDPESAGDRLSQIGTMWDEVRRAQTALGPQAQMAQETLFQRYSGAARRYLLAALGDKAAADDLTQEFGLALVQGKFSQADPHRGRFRDYLKGVLFHLVSQYRRSQKRQSLLARWWPRRSAPVQDEDRDRQFKLSWRDELLAKTWEALASQQPDFFTVLHHRAAHPDQSMEELAVALRPQLARTVTVDNLRQMLHRARKAFTQLLLAEVGQSLPEPNLEGVYRELADLELLPYLSGDRLCS